MRRATLSRLALLLLLTLALAACLADNGTRTAESRSQESAGGRQTQFPATATSRPSTRTPQPATATALPRTALHASTSTPWAATATPPPATPVPLASQIEQIIAQSGGRWHILIQPLDGGPPLYARDPDRRITIASVVKVPLAMLFFAALEQNGIPEAELPAYLQSTGVGGRTFDQLLYAMLVRSEEKATAILEEYTRTALNLPAQQRAWGWEHLDLEARRDTAAGVAEIFTELYRGEHVSPTARRLILDYLSAYTPADDTRIGVLRGQLPPGARLYNKRGSLLTPYVVADVAILDLPAGTDYLLVLFAYNGEPKTTYERLDAAIAEIAQAFWDSLAGQSPPP